MNRPLLRTMRWWDVAALMPLERQLFGPSAWSAETFWAELAHPETRWYVVAVDDAPGPDGPDGRDSTDNTDGADGPDGLDSTDSTYGADGTVGAASVLGYAGLLVPGPEADVQTVAVHPAAQGRGLGGVLVDALIDRARARGATSLMLEVRADNDPAVRLYRGRGFEQIALRRRYYQPEDADALVMRLRPLTP